MNIKLTYDAKVVNGKVELEYPFKFKNEVANTFGENQITITVEKKKRKRSLNQMETNVTTNTDPQHDAKLPVSGQLPPLQVTDKEYKKLMKALYPKDRSKKFRR